MESRVDLAYDFPVLGAFWTVFLLTLAFLWIVLIFRVIADIFRDDRLSGWAKTGWLVFVILLPFLGVFLYVATRGSDMGAREARHAQDRMKEYDSFVHAAGTVGSQQSEADQLAKLIEMRNQGAISDEEFRQAKIRVLR